MPTETPPEVAIIIATLHTAAEWLNDKDRDLLHETAERTEQDWDGTCCPVCDEIECDTGCPLEHVRGRLHKAT